MQLFYIMQYPPKIYQAHKATQQLLHGTLRETEEKSYLYNIGVRGNNMVSANVINTFVLHATKQ